MRLKTLLGACALVLGTASCVVVLDGAGEAGIGYSSESKLYTYHSVDGDKEGNTSRSELDLHTLLDFLAQPDEPTEDPVPPATDER